MKILKVIKNAIVLGVFAALIACEKEDADLKRTFHMGFTPFPYATSAEAVDFTYEKLAQDGDIINHHFDKGVPWKEASLDEPFPATIMLDWTFRKKNTPPGVKTYVSVAPLNFDRNNLAASLSETGDVSLQAPWNTYQFNDEAVKVAYLNYCKRVIEFFQPDFFNMGVEANLVYYNNPAIWSQFLDFHQFVYQELKKEYPDLTIFTSVAGAHMLKGYFNGNDHVQQRLATLQLLENSDLYAISFYPYLSEYLGNPYPEETFGELFNISSKPLAIAETGYAAQPFTIRTPHGDATISSDADKQNKFLKELLLACEKRNAKFVINFVLRDYDQLWQSLGSKNDLTIAWRDTGLYDEAGNARPGYATWKQYLIRKHHVE